MNQLKPCPFCGGKDVRIYVCDSEGNVKTEEYEFDPVHGLSYAIGHHNNHELCPVATWEDEILGRYLCDTKEEAISLWNERVDEVKR